jgi:hypothetical protein
VAALKADESGRAQFRDHDVAPGKRYGYRLGLQDGKTEIVGGEAWVDVPLLGLSLQGAVPNPSRSLVINFSLTNSSPSTLELFDVTGRKVWSKSVGSLGSGMHSLKLNERKSLSSGVYLVRLTQSGMTLSRKAMLLP